MFLDWQLGSMIKILIVRTMIGKWSLVALHIHSEQTGGGQLMAFWIRKMSLGGVWESGATYGFVQGAGVTSFTPLAVVGLTNWAGVHLLGRDK